MTQIKSIFSSLFRKLKRYSINMLDFFAYNTYYNYISFIILLICIFNRTPIWNVIWSFIVITNAIGLIYEIFDKNKKIARLEKALEATGQALDYDLLVDNLAPIMHDIWSKDVYNLENPTTDEFGRANTKYNDLSDNDKEHNKKKAQLIIDWLDEQ